MCSPQNQVIVDNVINDFVQNNKPFTAFDVTQEARKQDATEFHGQMKASVHGRWADLQNHNYQRQTVSLAGSPVDPWLYFPQGYDPVDYVNAINAGNTVPAGVASPAHPSGIAQPDDDDDDDDATADYTTGSLTSEDRLAIPTSMLRDIGVDAYDTVHVIAIPNDKKIEIRVDIGPNGIDPSNYVSEYETGRRMKVRISKRIMDKANVSGTVFKIEKVGDSILVTA